MAKNLNTGVNGLKVMVIDDSKTIRRTAETLLVKAGFEVLTATDGFEALSLVTDRGRFMQDLPSGSMLAVTLSQQEVESYLDGNLDLAVINAPSLCVVSGERNAVDALESELAED